MKRRLWPLLLSGVLYGLWVTDLYRVHAGRLQRWDWLIPLNAFVGALGAWVLSTRWLRSLGGRFLAGAVYGLGPYALTLLRYHPWAGTLAALVPWGFYPAFHAALRTGGGRSAGLGLSRRMLRLLAATLPWAAVVLFFQVSNQLRRFVFPLRPGQEVWADWPSLLVPWVMAERGRLLYGVYHVPLSVGLIGLWLWFRARRWGPLGCMVLAAVLTACPGLWQVSPLAWMAVLWTFAAIACGLGAEALVTAGRSDVRTMIWAPVTQAVAAAGVLWVAGDLFQRWFAGQPARLCWITARFYLLGAVCLAAVVTVAFQGRRWRALRWALVGLAVGLDVWLSSRFLVDRLL